MSLSNRSHRTRLGIAINGPTAIDYDHAASRTIRVRFCTSTTPARCSAGLHQPSCSTTLTRTVLLSSLLGKSHRLSVDRNGARHASINPRTFETQAFASTRCNQTGATHDLDRSMPPLAPRSHHTSHLTPHTTHAVPYTRSRLVQLDIFFFAASSHSLASMILLPCTWSQSRRCCACADWDCCDRR